MSSSQKRPRNKQHCIDYVYCRCGYVFKLDFNDIEITCIYCDRVIYDLDGYCKTVVETEDDHNEDTYQMDGPVEDCEKCARLTSNSDAIKAFIQTINDIESRPRTILDDIQERMNSDPELVHKLIIDILCLEQDNADLRRKLDSVTAKAMTCTHT